VVDLLLVLIELIFPALTVEALIADIGRNRGVRKWRVTFSTNFRGHGAYSTNDCWRQKTRVHELSRGVVCMILRLVVLIQYRRVADRLTHRQKQTDTRTHDDG